MSDEYIESMGILYGCNKPKTRSNNHDIVYARGYILGYLDAMKKSNISGYNKLNMLWSKIDRIKNKHIRHRKVMELYRKLDFDALLSLDD